MFLCQRESDYGKRVYCRSTRRHSSERNMGAAGEVGGENIAVLNGQGTQTVRQPGRAHVNDGMYGRFCRWFSSADQRSLLLKAIQGGCRELSARHKWLHLCTSYVLLPSKQKVSSVLSRRTWRKMLQSCSNGPQSCPTALGLTPDKLGAGGACAMPFLRLWSRGRNF